MAEAGVAGYEMVGWNGIFVAKGHAACDRGPARRRAGESPRPAGLKEQMATLGAEPGGDTPQAFGAFVSRRSPARWGRIIKEKGIRPE